MTPFPPPRPETRIGHKTILTDEQQDWIRRWFPNAEIRQMARTSGLSESFIWRFAKSEGLKKTEKKKRALMKRSAQRAKKTMEANGYYDSLRGKPLEKATDGLRRLWQQGFHPYQKLSKKKYEEMLARKSRVRKETVRRERLHAFYGLERQTRLNLPMKKYTQSQKNHRYNALRRGYLLPTDLAENHGERYIIYYDDQTVRCPRFEANCEKDGFTLKKYE